MTFRFIAAAVLFVAPLMWDDKAGAQTAAYSFSVSRHRDVPAIGEAEVGAILAKASKMLKKDSNHDDPDDAACNITLALKGSVRSFTSPSTAVVDENNIEDFHDVDSNVAGDVHVKIVKEIQFCRKGNPGREFAGCSYSPPDFRSIILVHPKLHKDRDGNTLSDYPDHLLWAHEFGHLTGLGHRHDRSPALMTACPLSVFSRSADSCVRVSRAECKNMLSGPGKRPPPPFLQCLLPSTVPACQ